MTQFLDNLVKTGKLKVEAFSQTEFDGLVSSATKRLTDANNATLSDESRFDLAYNAAHALALAALRKKGYRSENRYLVFQILEQTAGLPAAKWRVLSKSHDARNLAEYEGHTEVDTTLLKDLLTVTAELKGAVQAI
jgi:hypothetical protein